MTDTSHNDRRFLRQLGIYNPTEHANDSVMFIGVGGIGSFAAIGAAKLGIPNISILDPDTVEEHNQPNQFYTTDDLDRLKVDALSGHMFNQGGEQLSVAAFPLAYPNEEWTPQLSGVVVSGLDSMEARTNVWDGVKLNPRIPLYLDARIGGAFIVVYAVNPTSMDDCDAYEKTLYSDEDAEDTACTERGIIDVGLQVGAIITRALRLHFTGEPVDRITMMNQATLMSTKGDWVND